MKKKIISFEPQTPIKEYDAIIKVEWATSFEAISEQDFIEKAKEQWNQDYNIELVDDEIKIIHIGEKNE